MRPCEKRFSVSLMICSVLFFLLFQTLPLIVHADNPTLVQITPINRVVSAGQMFFINVTCTPGQAIKAFELKILFNPAFLRVNAVSEGTIFQVYPTFFNAGTINNTVGIVTNIYGLIIGDDSVVQTGTLVSLSCTARFASGTSSITLFESGVTNHTTYVPITLTNGTVTLREYSLDVMVDGSGVVTKNPTKTTYTYGENVTLSAVASSGWLFSAWTGDIIGTQTPKTITMNGDKEVTAHFLNSLAPQISGVTRTTSTPLDTNPAFGWVNISCIVTDDEAVSQVILRIQTPGGIWHNMTMITGVAGRYYYRSTTTFSSEGNYSYSIWATDPDENTATSTSIRFSMPANWDLDGDGYWTIFDLVLISNHYGENGMPGWIREDADNNGAIQIQDLMFVSNYNGQSWW